MAFRQAACVFSPCYLAHPGLQLREPEDPEYALHNLASAAKPALLAFIPRTTLWTAAFVAVTCECLQSILRCRCPLQLCGCELYSTSCTGSKAAGASHAQLHVTENVRQGPEALLSPAGALNLWGGILIQKRRAEKALEASGMAYLIVRPGGMEKPGDDYKRTNNVRLMSRDKAFGGLVSRLQVAELITAAIANPGLAENKASAHMQLVACTSGIGTSSRDKTLHCT